MRHVIRGLIVFVVGVLTSGIGVLAALTLTPPGRTLLARNVSHLLDTLLRGEVVVGNIGGSFLRDLVLRDVVVRDTAGVLLASLPRARLSYLIPNLIARRFILETLVVDEPVINLVRHANGRWNYEEVLRLNEGGPGGTSPLIEFRDLRIDHGTVSLAIPWPGKDVTGSRREEMIASARAEGRMVADTPEGTRQIIAFSDVTAGVRRLRIATPDRLPLLAVIDTLRVDVSDPQARVRDLQGTIEAKGDTLRFSVGRAVLPGTVASAEGMISWPQDTILWNFRASADSLDLKDLRFIAPDFPDMQGHADVVATSRSNSVTDYDITDLALSAGPEQVTGELVAVVDVRRGLGVRDARLRLASFNLDKVRPFVDSLPFIGTVSGDVNADGLLTNVAASGAITFVDFGVPAHPVTTLAFDGRFQAGEAGLQFDSVQVSESDVDLRTVRRLAPAVIVEGRVRAAGVINGPLDDVTFTGVARHRDGDRPESVIDGTTRLDSRDRKAPLRVAADLTLAPLSFEGIRRSFPAIKSQGDLRGRVHLEGPVDDLFIDADVTGEIGTIRGSGTVTILPPRWAADTLRLAYENLDLAKLLGSGASTSLNGTVAVTGTIDTLVAPEGTLELLLAPSVARGVVIDSLLLRAQVQDSVLQVDTLGGTAEGLVLAGSGNLGWARPHAGNMSFTLEADSLGGLDSLAQSLSGFLHDTLPGWRPLNGVLRMRADLAGSIDSLEATGTASIDAFTFHHFKAGQVTASAAYTGGTRPALTLDAVVDSLDRDNRYLRQLRLTMTGPIDSTRWGLFADVGGAIGVAGSGTFTSSDTARTVMLDALGLDLPSRAWQLTKGGVLTLTDSAISITPIELAASDGSGFLRIGGRAPWESEGAMTVEALGISVTDLYALAQYDTLGTGGWLGMNLEFGGTRYAPTLGGTLTIEDITVGETQGPFIQGVLRYGEKRFEGGLLLYRTGEPVLQVRYSLPVDLALVKIEDRRVDGPLSVSATADSVDLSVVEALVPTVRNVHGTMDAAVRVEGTWANPDLGGAVAVKNGGAFLRSLGVRFDSINGRLELAGDSIYVKDVDVSSERGNMRLSGNIFLEGLTRPVLDLQARLNQFTAINQPDFLTLTASGRLGIQGPLDALVLTGAITADRGALYFADMLTRRVIDLDDPENLAFIDTTIIRRRNLGTDLSSRLMQSIQVRDLGLRIGGDFWLRSNEANIQLDGSVRADKVGQTYRVDGTMSAVRGRYRLSPFPGFSRDFDVVRGDVRFFGTSDLNAELDIEARYVVRTTRNQELPIIARITGTLQDPKLKLESTQRPPLSELDIASYLVTGAPASEAATQGQNVLVQNVSTYILSAGSSAIERALVSDLGLPVDMLQIRPVVSSYGGTTGSSGLSAAFALALGWQLSRNVFLTVNAGFCTASSATFDYRNFGAGIEWRMSQEWRVQAVMEPVLRYCGATAVGANVSSSLRYQLGVDVLWEREF